MDRVVAGDAHRAQGVGGSVVGACGNGHGYLKKWFE
jgi:hypothetical protein